MTTNPSLNRLRRKLTVAIPAAVKAAAIPAVVKSAEEMAATMRSLAASSRDTGALIDSIAVTGPLQKTPPYSQPGGSKLIPDNAAVVTVGNVNVRYPHLVEYGTATAPAQPFFWPAVRLNRKKAASRIKRAIGKAVREAK